MIKDAMNSARNTEMTEVHTVTGQKLAEKATNTHGEQIEKATNTTNDINANTLTPLQLKKLKATDENTVANASIIDCRQSQPFDF